MFNHIANELNAASAASAIRRQLTWLLAGWTGYLARKAAERRLNELNQHLLNDIGNPGAGTGPSALAAQNPRVIAVNLQLLRLP